MFRSAAVILALLALGSTAEAQFDTRFAFSLEGGGGVLMDAEEAEDASVIYLGGTGSLMLGARVGHLRPVAMGDLSFTLAYQGSVFVDSTAVLHRHHATLSVHAGWVTSIFGAGPSIITPYDDDFDDDSTVGGSVTIDMRINFGRSGVFLGIPFKVDFFPKSDLVLMQTVLSLGFQTF